MSRLKGVGKTETRGQLHQRREDYQPPQTPADSPFRKFDVKCLACGSYQLQMVAQMDEEAVGMAVVLVCNH